MSLDIISAESRRVATAGAHAANGEAVNGEAAGQSGRRAGTVLIECLDSRGHVQSRERFTLGPDTTGPRVLTVGRSVEADVTLDDEHAAPLHASIEIAADGRVLASDLGSVNGILVGGQRHHGVRGLVLVDNMLQIGRTQLRVRTAQDRLAPEKPDQLRPASLLRDPVWIAGLGALAVALQLAYGSWLGAPRDLAASIVTVLAWAVLAVTAWVGVWALLSRVMQGEWRWIRHAAIFLGVVAIYMAVDDLLSLSGHMLSLAPWSRRDGWLGAIALGCGLFLHLSQASNLSRRRVLQVACLVPALAGGTTYWLLERAQVRDVNHIEAGLRIYPPGLRLRAADTVGGYFKSAAALRAAADAKRQNVRSGEEQPDD